MLERILIAGSGGQGVLLIGKVLARVSMAHVEHVTFFPAYGAEVRGGTSNCQVTLSSSEIASPVPESVDSMILLNQASADRFLPSLERGKLAVVNSSMCETGGLVGAVTVPATEEADRLGDPRVANFAMLGAYIGARGVLPPDDVVQGIEQILAEKGPALIDLNVSAFRYGLEHHVVGAI